MNKVRLGQDGKIYLWTYPDGVKSYAGWHITADAIGTARLSDAIQVLLSASLSESRAFPVAPVTPAVLAVPNNRRAKARSAKDLRVRVAQEPRHFSLEERDQGLTIEVGRGRLEELRQNILRIAQREGDFAMIPDGKRYAPDQLLWFWWLLS